MSARITAIVALRLTPPTDLRRHRPHPGQRRRRRTAGAGRGRPAGAIAVLDDSRTFVSRRRRLGRAPRRRADRPLLLRLRPRLPRRRRRRSTRSPGRPPVLPRFALGQLVEPLPPLHRRRVPRADRPVRRRGHPVLGRACSTWTGTWSMSTRSTAAAGPATAGTASCSPTRRSSSRWLHEHGPAGDAQRAPGRRRPGLRGRLPADGRGAGPRPGARRPDRLRRHRPASSSTAYFDDPAPLAGARRRRLLVDRLAVRARTRGSPASTRCGCSTTSTSWTTPGTARRPLTFSRYAGPGSHRYPVGFSGDTAHHLGVAGLPAVLHRDRVQHRLRLVEPRHRRPHVRRQGRRAGHPLGAARRLLADPAAALRASARSTPRSRGGSAPRRSAVMTEFLRLRHRLLPYLHTMNHRAARDGAPLVQPMYWSHPDDRRRLRGAEPVHASAPSCWSHRSPRRQTRRASSAASAPGCRTVTWVDCSTAWCTPAAGRWCCTATCRDPGAGRCRCDRPARPQQLIPGNAPDNPAALEVLVVVGADGSFEMIEDDGTGSGLDPRNCCPDPDLVRSGVRLGDRRPDYGCDSMPARPAQLADHLRRNGSRRGRPDLRPHRRRRAERERPRRRPGGSV